MTMTKKSTQLFWHWVGDMRISCWLYISPRSFTDGYSSFWWASRSTSSWSCFSLWSARNSKYIRLQSKFFELHFRGFLLVVVVLHVVALKSVTYLFKPWKILTHEWELSLFTDLILISTPYLPCRQQIYFCVDGFSSSHHDSLRDTISWKRVVKDDCVLSSLIELKILSCEQVWCRPNTPCFDVSSTSSVCTMQDVVRPGQLLFGSLCSLFIGSTDVKNTVCLLLKICPPGTNPEFVMECKLKAHPTW